MSQSYTQDSFDLFFLSFLGHYDQQLLNRGTQMVAGKHLHICTDEKSQDNNVCKLLTANKFPHNNNNNINDSIIK